jgi:hypothetical protein
VSTVDVAGLTAGEERKVCGKQPNVYYAALYSFVPAVEDNRLVRFDPFLNFTGW